MVRLRGRAGGGAGAAVEILRRQRCCRSPRQGLGARRRQITLAGERLLIAGTGLLGTSYHVPEMVPPEHVGLATVTL
jgi:hypothetical protein